MKKINWGLGIVIAIISFIAFIMTMVYQMITDKKYDHDLVTEKYYQKELEFQNDINAVKNAKNLPKKIQLTKVNNNLHISFPTFFEAEKIKGNIFVYRPSNKNLDFTIPIKTKTNTIIILKKNLLQGRWNITVDFIYKNKHYIHKQKITY